MKIDDGRKIKMVKENGGKGTMEEKGNCMRKKSKGKKRGKMENGGVRKILEMEFQS